MLKKDIRDTMLEYLKEKQMEEIFRWSILPGTKLISS
jgi:hypothetical protein